MMSQGLVHLMSERLPESTPLRSTGSGGSLPPYREGARLETGTDFMQLLMLLRRRIGLVAGIAALIVFVVALFIVRERPVYRSTATLRLAYPRRALTVGVEDLPAAKNQGSDPLLSLIELLRGRAIVGAVVDSLALRLQPLGSWFGGHSRIVREWPPNHEPSGWSRSASESTTAPTIARPRSSSMSESRGSDPWFFAAGRSSTPTVSARRG